MKVRHTFAGVFVLALVVLFACTSSSERLPAVSERDVPRPALPRFFFVDQGEVACLNGTGVPCAGQTQGSIHAWYAFDENGLLHEYREDSVLYDPTPGALQGNVYLREYSNLTEATYFSLASNTAADLQCFKTPFGFFNYSRFFLQDAKYIGISEPMGPLSRGKLAYTFQAQWLLAGQPISVVAWVLVDQPDRIWGYHFLTIRYMMYNYHVMPNGFNPSPFVRPVGVPSCSAIAR